MGSARLLKKGLKYPLNKSKEIFNRSIGFKESGSKNDTLSPAIEALLSKRRKDRRWNLNAHNPSQTHFYMEKAGIPSRWNTLNALRILKHLNIE